jgi:cystathionine beta-lyase family protein involved in aluminum resistance
LLVITQKTSNEETSTLQKVIPSKSHSLRQLINQAKAKVKGQWERIEEMKLANQDRLLAAFRQHQVSEYHFAGSTGYGYNDSGREVIESVYAQVFGAEDALVRPQLVSGTHAIATCLSALLDPGDELVSVTGAPYDTLQQVIGVKGHLSSSLLRQGIRYKEAPLNEDGKWDKEAILATVSDKTKMVIIQRSRGYSWRPALSIQEIGDIVSLVRSIGKDIIIFVDNCYGEFVEHWEPCHVGADIVAGSLIKNPGGGLVAGGGYIAGSDRLVEIVADRMTAPGLGRRLGPTYGLNRWILQGLWMAPHMVGEALSGAVLVAKVMEDLGYLVSPQWDEPRGDIVQAVRLQGKTELLSFCHSIQAASPVDSFVLPVPGDMPGYEDAVVMAGGTFIQGSTMELSADGPLRSPYTVYLQGGLCKEHVELALYEVVESLVSDDPLVEGGC